MHIDQVCRLHEFTLKTFYKNKFFGCKLDKKLENSEFIFSMESMKRCLATNDEIFHILSQNGLQS